MVGDSDTKFTALAAEILREAVQALDREDVVSWLLAANVGMVGSGQVTGAIPVATGTSSATTRAFAAITGSFSAIGHGDGANAGAGLKKVFKLPRKLPGIRLPSDAQLAALARAAPLMTELEALAGWLGRDGRLVAAGDELCAADAANPAPLLDARPQYLPYLIDYALTARWLVLDDEPGSNRTWVMLGETASRWADGDDSGALHAWATVFSALLARTLDVSASTNLRASRELKFQGQGVAAAITLFLAGRSRLSSADVRDLIKSGAIGDRPSLRGLRAWDGWVRGHGNPASWLISELEALRAIDTPGADGTIELTPLALWALRQQLRLDGIEIPLLRTTPAQMTAASLVAFVDDVGRGDGEAEFAAWVGARGQDQAARELLVFAAFSGPQLRLTALNLVRRLGAAAHPAWRGAMQRPELRGYARMALAAALPGSTTRSALAPDHDDLARVAADLIALACGEENPDPQKISAQFSDAIPEGEESWIFDLMGQSSHPDVGRVLVVLGRHHPDRQVAKDARHAARSAARNLAARNRMAPRAGSVPARASRR